jgi:hypothetical protein
MSTGTVVGILGFLIFFVLIGLFVYFVYRKRAEIQKALRERGITIMADLIQHVDEIRRSTDSDGSRTTSHSYGVIVRFSVNGTPYERKIYTHFSTFALLKDATQVELVYLPENPEVVWIKRDLNLNPFGRNTAG